MKTSETTVNVEANIDGINNISAQLEAIKTLKWDSPIGEKNIGFDKETNEIVIGEEELMRTIMILNPAQKPKKIRLVESIFAWRRENVT